jgi:hypothetical protein
MERDSLAWSRWSRCESSFSLALTPRQPGVFAIAEEIIAGESGPAFAATGSRRMLAILEIATAEDLSRTLSQLFASTSVLRDRLLSGRCYIRYAVVPDPAERAAVAAALQQWVATANEAATGFASGLVAPDPEPKTSLIQEPKRPSVPTPLPSGF